MGSRALPMVVQLGLRCVAHRCLGNCGGVGRPLVTVNALLELLSRLHEAADEELFPDDPSFGLVVQEALRKGYRLLPKEASAMLAGVWPSVCAVRTHCGSGGVATPPLFPSLFACLAAAPKACAAASCLRSVLATLLLLQKRSRCC